MPSSEGQPQTSATPPTPPSTRRIGAIDGLGRGVMITQPMPEVHAGEVLVKVHRSTISAGTELRVAAQQRSGDGQNKDQQPNPFGYQNAGVVAEVGQGVTRLKPGDRVACLGGGYAQHSDWAVAPQNLCALIPDGVNFESAASMNVVLTALQAIRRAQPMLGEWMLIVGLGMVGQYASQMAALAGMRVMGWDMAPSRLDRARGCGIGATANPANEDAQAAAQRFTAGQGFDAAVMAFGGDGTKAIEQVAQAMKHTADGHAMGRIVLPGGLTTNVQWGSKLANLDLRSSARTGPGYHDKAWERGDVSYPPVFVRWDTQTSLNLALHWIATDQLQVEPLITHRFSLDQIGEAVDLLIDHPDQGLGVILEMDA